VPLLTKPSFHENTTRVPSLLARLIQVLSVDRRPQEWSDEDLQTMALWGNDRAHAYFPPPMTVLMQRYWNSQGLAKGKPDMPKNLRRKLIERKYVDKYWIPRTDTWDVEMHAKYPLVPDELAVLDYLTARKKTIADITPSMPTAPKPAARGHRRDEKRAVDHRRWSSEIVCNGRRVVMVGDAGSVSGRSVKSERVINDGRMKRMQDPMEVYHYLSKRRASILGKDAAEWGPLGQGATRRDVPPPTGWPTVDQEERWESDVFQEEVGWEPVVVDVKNEPLEIEVMEPFRSQGDEGSHAVDEKHLPESQVMKPLVQEAVPSREASVGDLIDFMGDASLDENAFDGGDLFEFDGFHGARSTQASLDFEPDN
jgi:hypothetical protein